jgi:hypothetical protein
MAYRKTSSAEAVTSASTTVIGTIALGAGYGVVLGVFARNWASSAKAANGTSSTQKLKLTDAALRVFYLDAADRDYRAGVYLMLVGQDEVNTGLTPVPVDSTGGAPVAGDGASGVFVAQSPISVEVQNAEVSTDYFEAYLLVGV